MDIEGYENAELRKKSMVVAALFISAVAVALVFAYWIGAFGLGPSKHIYVKYHFAGGIETASTVRLAGIKVGRVTNIDFTPSADASAVGSTSVKLKLEVRPEVLKYISNDSEIFINLAGLIGERYIEIVPGKGTPVADEHVFEGIDPPRIDQILSQGFGIFGDLRKLFDENKTDIKEMLASLNQLSQSLNKLLGNEKGANRGPHAEQLGRILKNLSDMSAHLKTVMANTEAATNYMKEHGSAETWDAVRKTLSKASKLSESDVRRLMLEDGVKINFSSRKVIDPSGGGSDDNR